MKSSTFRNLSTFITFFLVFFVVFSGIGWWYLLILIPVNVYAQIYASQQYSFRESLSLNEIPFNGYEKRIAELNSHAEHLYNLGFIKFDEFYLNTSNDAVCYAYSHENLPIIFCQYHFETGIFCDFDTKFENGFSLTTSNTKFSSISEIRPENLLLQAYPELSVEELLTKHQQSLSFLENQGFVSQKSGLNNFRNNFLEEYLETGKKMKGISAPFKIAYLLYYGNKVKYTKSIQEQFLSKTLRLP